MEGFGAIFMRYYAAIFSAALLLAAGGDYFFHGNTITANIPDSLVSSRLPLGVNLDNNIQPHRGSGR